MIINSDSTKSRKRPRQNTYFPPRKRARVDDDISCINIRRRRRWGQNNNCKYDASSRRGDENVQIILESDSIIASASRKCKRLANNSNKKQYQRPMIRLLTASKMHKSNHRGSSKFSSARAQSSFGELIAQGRITHILKECHAKAFANGSSNDEDNGARDDSLYGSGGNNTACTFGDMTFQSSLMPKEVVERKEASPPATPKRRPVAKRTAASPTSVAVLLEEEENDEGVDTTINGEEEQNENGDGAKECTDHDNDEPDLDNHPQSNTTTDNDISSFHECLDSEELHNDEEEDINLNTPREDEINTSPPPSVTNSSCTSTQTECSGLVEPLDVSVDNVQDPSGGALPFYVMSEEEPTAASNSSSPIFSFAGRGYSSSDAPPSSLCSGSSPSTCLVMKEYSPIRPRSSKGPIMVASYPTSISLSQSPSSSTASTTPPIHYDYSPPFNFMAKDYSIQQQSGYFQSIPNNTEYVSSSECTTLASLVKSILRFVAEWFLSLMMMHRVQHNGEDDNRNPRQSTVQPDISDKASIHHPTVPSISHRFLRSLSAPSLASNHAQYRSGSSNRPPTNGNKASSIPTSKATPNNCHNDCVKKKPSNNIQPPSDWKSLFRPKEGEWKCKICFYTNPPEAMTCDSCTAIKDRPANETLKSCLRGSSVHVKKNPVSNKSNVGKTPAKVRKERDYDVDDDDSDDDDSSRNDGDDEHSSDQSVSSSESYSSYESDSQESFKGAPEWTGESKDDEEGVDDEQYDEEDVPEEESDEEDSSPNKRVKRFDEPNPSSSNAPPPPPLTVRKAPRPSYELISDLQQNEGSAVAAAFTSSKRVKRDDIVTRPDIIQKRAASDTMSEDLILPNQVNKMARDQLQNVDATLEMDDVSVQYSEMDADTPGLVRRSGSDTMSEDMISERGFLYK